MKVICWRFDINHFLLLFDICARVLREIFVYKHSETVDHVKNYTNFQQTREFLGLIMQNFQAIVFT